LFADKIEKWRAQPTTSLQLVTNALMLSLLAVGAGSGHELARRSGVPAQAASGALVDGL
jgi:hypothetical protein